MRSGNFARLEPVYSEVTDVSVFQSEGAGSAHPHLCMSVPFPLGCMCSRPTGCMHSLVSLCVYASMCMCVSVNLQMDMGTLVVPRKLSLIQC